MSFNYSISSEPVCFQQNSTRSMDSLPPELLIILLTKLTNHIPSLLNLSLTSTQFYQLIQNNQLLWKDLFHQHFCDPYSYFPSMKQSHHPQPTTLLPHDQDRDWKKLFRDTYPVLNNWKRGKAIVSPLPGNCLVFQWRRRKRGRRAVVAMLFHLLFLCCCGLKIIITISWEDTISTFFSFIFSFLNAGSSLFSQSVKNIYLSNRYLIYTLKGVDNYVIYDFFHKQLITDRPIITSLITIGTNGRYERRDCSGISSVWHREDYWILCGNGICNLWDIETNELFYIQFDVSEYRLLLLWNSIYTTFLYWFQRESYFFPNPILPSSYAFFCLRYNN